MKLVVTIVGKDRVGIIAMVSQVLAENNVNIEDISQTILQDIFTMTMLIDLSVTTIEFASLQERLTALSEELGVQISMQREEVFKYMYRL